jgi:hypothetical protein
VLLAMGIAARLLQWLDRFCEPLVELGLRAIRLIGLDVCCTGGLFA